MLNNQIKFVKGYALLCALLSLFDISSLKGINFSEIFNLIYHRY